jgi:hypothetical protein
MGGFGIRQLAVVPEFDGPDATNGDLADYQQA